jgi:HEAT repeat protein
LTVASGPTRSGGGRETELDERIRRVDPDSERPWLREGVAALGIRTVRELDDLIDVQQPEHVQIDACVVAGSVGDRRSSVPRLVRLLAETVSDGLRVQAAVALSQLGGRHASRLLERVVLTHSEPRTREMAAYALAFGRDHAEADFLLNVLNRHDEHPAVRAQAAEGIGNLVDRRSRRRFLPHLVRALSDPAPEVRFWACFALSGLGGEAEIPALERLLDDRSVPGSWTWSVRREARWAIDCIRGYPSAEWPQAGEI